MTNSVRLSVDRTGAMICCIEMSTGDLRSRASASCRASLSLVAVLMLLGFPLQRAHTSLSHFRAHEVRRSVLSHTLLERTPETTIAKAAYKCPGKFVRLLEDCDEAESAIESSTIPTIPVRLFLTRFKLGPSHAGGQDPLLH